jgi:hypothetical protein
MDGMLVASGTVLAGRYALERELGRGGMATVYLARDTRHDRLVAVKILRQEVAASVGGQRFLREIEIAAHLTHPHILPLHDSGDADGALFYVMPFLEGESLRERLKREGPLPVDDALQIAAEIADALSYAHAKGVVHRDIKPGNILLQAGHAVVADFGIARAISEAVGDRVTSAGLALGTPTYMSPEQANAVDTVDGRTDIYSLGCLLYEMLAGSPPFTATTVQGVVAQHLNEVPPLLRLVRRSVPVEVELVVARMLAKLPADRFADAGDLGRRLEEAAGRLGKRPRRVAGRYLAAGAAAVAIGGLVLYGAIARRTPAAPAAAIGTVVLPFSRVPGDSLAFQGTPPHLLFTQALDWIPGVQGVDGSSLVPPSGSWRSKPPQELSREAVGLGGRYLVAGSIMARPEGAEVNVDLYRAGTGERVLHLADTAQGGKLGPVIERLALQSVGALWHREGLDLSSRRAVLASTGSLPAVGHLLQGQAKYWHSDFAGAAADFQAAIEADSGCGLAYHRLSVAEVWRHDYPAALRAVESGLRRRNRLERRWINLLEAQRQFVLGHGDSAIAGFQGVVLDDRTDADGWLGLGESLVHYGGFSGDSPLDARPAFERLVRLDSAFAPIYDHLIDLAVYAGDERAARGYLARIPPENPARIARLAEVALRFGSPEERSAALAELRTADRQAISEAVISWMHGAFALDLADTAAGFLLGPDRTPDDRRRGAQYRLVARAGQHRWAEGLRTWIAVAGGEPFDPWIVQAFLAGYPARELDEPMLRWARAQVADGRAPDFSRPPWDDTRQGFEALVYRATVEGDSLEALDLLGRIDRSPPVDPAEPSPGALRASLQARLALLAGDTTKAIALLEQSVSRIVEIYTANHPFTAMGPQRLLLSRLLSARGDTAGAARWRNSFLGSWCVADILYLPELRGPGG